MTKPTPKPTGFDIQAQDLRDRVVQLERELATARTAHEVTAQERDKAVTELAMMRIWIEQARPVVEAVREFQKCPFNQDDLNERTAALMAIEIPEDSHG